MPSKRTGVVLGDGIPLCVPELSGNEWKYVKECLDTNWLSYVGSYVGRFEEGVAQYVGMRYAVATNSGTAALHIALLVAGIEPDDEVLLSNVTFVATANAVRYCGAWPVLIDVSADTWQMDPEKLAQFLRKECVRRHDGLRDRMTGRRIRAVLPVHILGHPCDMEPIMSLAQEYGLTVIEDAAEALGARYRDRKSARSGMPPASVSMGIRL